MGKKLVQRTSRHGDNLRSDHGIVASKKTTDIKHALQTEEGFASKQEPGMMYVMKPLYRAKAIFGLLWKTRKHMFEKKMSTFDFCTVHSCIVILGTWLNVLRCFANYSGTDGYGAKLFGKICYHLADLQFACGISSHIYFKHKYIPAFVTMWEKYKIKHGGVPLKTLRRNVLVRLIPINIVFAVLFLGATATLVIKKRELITKHHMAFLEKLGITVPLWLITIYMCWYFYLALAWMQSLILSLCINTNLKQEFTEFASQLRADTQAMRGEQPKKLVDSQTTEYSSNALSRGVIEHFRQRYIELCDLVARYDDVISSYLLFLYMFSLPAIIFLAYALTGLDKDSHPDLTYFLISISSIVFYVSVLVSVTASASALTVAVSVFHFTARAPAHAHAGFCSLHAH